MSITSVHMMLPWQWWRNWLAVPEWLASQMLGLWERHIIEKMFRVLTCDIAQGFPHRDKRPACLFLFWQSMGSENLTCSRPNTVSTLSGKTSGVASPKKKGSSDSVMINLLHDLLAIDFRAWSLKASLVVILSCKIVTRCRCLRDTGMLRIYESTIR